MPEGSKCEGQCWCKQPFWDALEETFLSVPGIKLKFLGCLVRVVIAVPIVISWYKLVTHQHFIIIIVIIIIIIIVIVVTIIIIFININQMFCEILGSRGDDNKDCCPLKCDPV
jgi:hypothetical protein